MNKQAIILWKSPYWQMAKLLKQKGGWDVCGFSPLWVKKTEQFKQICSQYLDLYAVIEKAKASPVPRDIIARSRSIERLYDLNLADIISPDRHLGIGWVTGGLYHRGKLSYMPYERHLHIISEVFSSFECFLQRVNPEFVCCGGVGSFEGAVVYSVCKRNQVPVYGLANVGDGQFYYWQNERTQQIPKLEEFYLHLESSNVQVNGNAAMDIASRVRNSTSEYMRKGKLFTFLQGLRRLAYQQAMRKALGLKKPGEVPFSSKASYIARNYLNYRKEMRREYLPIEEIEKLDYVFYPLHFEPEASLNGIEPYFTNQMYAVELLSKSVPAGVYVLVKEHPSGVGNRPRHWMDTIAGFPRVKLINPFVSSLEIIHHSLATATITGTPGLEAAIIGKPVISLGPCYRFNFVKHVFFANDMLALRELIRRIYEERDASDFYQDGARLRQAIEMTCFKIDEHMYSGNPSDASVELACDKLLELHSEAIGRTQVTAT